MTNSEEENSEEENSEEENSEEEDSEEEDSVLVARVCKGDHDAFQTLYDRYYRYTCLVAYGVLSRYPSLCCPPEEAKDQAQVSWVKVLLNADKYNQELRFRPWLHTIVVNTCRSFLRSRRLRPPETPVMDLEALGAPAASHYDPGGLSADEDLVLWAKKDLVLRALDSLRPDRREVFVRRDLLKWSRAETAASLGLALEQVDRRLYKARPQFAAFIRREFPDLPGGE